MIELYSVNWLRKIADAPGTPSCSEVFYPGDFVTSGDFVTWKWRRTAPSSRSRSPRELGVIIADDSFDHKFVLVLWSDS